MATGSVRLRPPGRTQALPPYGGPRELTTDEIIAANQHLLEEPPPPPPPPGFMGRLWNAFTGAFRPEGETPEIPAPAEPPTPEPAIQPAPGEEPIPQEPRPGRQLAFGTQVYPGVMAGTAHTLEKLQDLANLFSRGLRAIGLPPSLTTPGGGFQQLAEVYKQEAAEFAPPQGILEKVQRGVGEFLPTYLELVAYLRPFGAATGVAANRLIGQLPATLSAAERATAISRIQLAAQTASSGVGLGTHAAGTAALAGQPAGEVAKAGALGFGAGLAFGQLGRLPWYLRPPGAGTVFAGQTVAAEGAETKLEDVVSSFLTGAALDAPAARAQRRASLAQQQMREYRERVERLMREDEARAAREAEARRPRALPPAPEIPPSPDMAERIEAFRQAAGRPPTREELVTILQRPAAERVTRPGVAIPMEEGILWPAEKVDFIRQQAAEGKSPEEIQVLLRQRLFPEKGFISPDVRKEPPGELEQIRAIWQQVNPPTPAGVAPERVAGAPPEELQRPPTALMRRPTEPGPPRHPDLDARAQELAQAGKGRDDILYALHNDEQLRTLVPTGYEGRVQEIIRETLDQRARDLAIKGMDGRRIMYELYQDRRYQDLVDETYRARAISISANPAIVPPPARPLPRPPVTKAKPVTPTAPVAPTVPAAPTAPTPAAPTPPRPPAEPGAPAAKSPWEMTAAEYNAWTADELEKRSADVLARIKEGKLPRSLEQDARGEAIKAERLRRGESLVDVNAQRLVMLKRRLRTGEPVPPSVLAEFPELQGVGPTAAPPTEEIPRPPVTRKKGEEITWKDDKGRTLTGKFVKQVGDILVVKSKGKNYDVTPGMIQAATTPAAAPTPTEGPPAPPAPSAAEPDFGRTIDPKEVKAARQHPDFQFLVDLLGDKEWGFEGMTKARKEQEATRILADLPGATREQMIPYAQTPIKDRAAAYRRWREEEIARQKPPAAPPGPPEGPPGAPPGPPTAGPVPPTEMPRPPAPAMTEEEYQRQARLQPVRGRAAIFERVAGRPPTNAELLAIGTRTPDEVEAFATRIKQMEGKAPAAPRTSAQSFAEAERLAREIDATNPEAVLMAIDRAHQAGKQGEAARRMAAGQYVPTLETPEATRAAIEEFVQRTERLEPIVREAMAADRRQREAAEPVREATVTPQGEVGPVQGPRGATTIAIDAEGNPVEAQYVLEDIRLVVPSDTLTGQVNPIFPQKLLQARTVEAKVRQQLVNSIAANPYESLTLSSGTVPDGTPWLNPADRTAPVGNTRIRGLLLAALGRGPNARAWEKYRTDLERNLEHTGFTVEQVRSNPFYALFRVPMDPATDWAKFARLGNIEGTTRYSQSETAREDAKRLTSERLLELKHLDDPEKTVDDILQMEDNASWVAETLRSLAPQSEWPTVFETKSGTPSKPGYDRIKAAIFQFAYQPSGHLTGLLTESKDPEKNKILKAMLMAAPKVAASDALMPAGEPALGPDIAAAADKFFALQRKKESVADYLKQVPGIFGAELTPSQRAILKELDPRQGSGRSANALAEYLGKLADATLAASKRGGRDQIDLLQTGQPFQPAPFSGYDAELDQRAREILRPYEEQRSAGGGEAGFITIDGQRFGLAEGAMDHPESADRIMGEEGRTTGYPDENVWRLQKRTGMIRVVQGGFSTVRLPTAAQIRAMVETALGSREKQFYFDFDSPIGPPGKVVMSEVLVEPDAKDIRRLYGRVKNFLLGNGWINQGEAEGSFLVEQRTEPFETGRIFYSALRRAAEDRLPNSAPPDQILRTLTKGVKEAEIQWSGLREWLAAQDRPVSKKEVLDFLDANEVKMQETQLGGPDVELEARIREIVARRDQLGEEYGRLLEVVAGDLEKAGYGRLRAFDIANQIGKGKITPEDYIEATKAMGLTAGADIATHFRVMNPINALNKVWVDDHALARELDQLLTQRRAARDVPYRQYIEPGGENYRVFLWRIPGLKPEYQEPHFLSRAIGSNVFAHARATDRRPQGGGRMLLLEEIQSELAKQGRQRGFLDRSVLRHLEEGRLPPGWQLTENTPLRRWSDETVDRAMRGMLRTDPATNEPIDVTALQRKEYSIIDENGTAIAYNADSPEEAFREAPRNYRVFKGDQPPYFPFAKNWHEVVMKRLLRYAVENGYDSIGWTTGQQQADRYDLSKAVDEVEVFRSADHFTIKATQGDTIVASQMSKSVEEVAGLVGKDLAEKIAALPPGTGKVFSGLDLQIGGEWARRLYDEMIPQFLNGYTKKWGGRVTEDRIDTGAFDRGVSDEAQSALENRLIAAGLSAREIDGISENWGTWGEQRARGAAPEAVEAYNREYEKAQGERIHALTITPEMRQSLMEPQALFQPEEYFRTQPPLFPPEAIQKIGPRVESLGGVLRRTATVASVVADRINDAFRRGQRIQLEGAKLASAEDAAVAAQLLRSPVETMWIHAVKAGRVVASRSVSSRMPNMVTSFFTSGKEYSLALRRHTAGEISQEELNRVIDHAFETDVRRLQHWLRRVGADEYWLTHNHPSGYSLPSVGDEIVTNRLAERLPGFRGHVVTDSGEYSIIWPDAVMQERLPLPGAPAEDQFLTPTVPHEMLGVHLKGEMIARLGRDLGSDPNRLTLFYLNSYNYVNGITRVPVAWLKQGAQFANYLRNQARHYGATRAAAYYDGPDRLQEPLRGLIQQGVLVDAVVGDQNLTRFLEPVISMPDNPRNRWMGQGKYPMPFTLAQPTEEFTPGERPTREQIAERARKSLEEATIDTRLSEPGSWLFAGRIEQGRLVTQHVAEEPARIVSLLAVSQDIRDTQSEGPLGRGLYFGTHYTTDPDAIRSTPVAMEVQGSFLDLYRLGADGLKALDAEARHWLRENEYVTARGEPTDLGKAVIDQAKHPDGLRYEYVKSLGYDGLLFGAGRSQGAQGIVWNTDAVRRYGDWTNPRPAPGVAGRGVYAAPPAGYIRLFRGEVEAEASFTDDLEAARSTEPDPGRMRYVDVPIEIADAAKVSEREWHLPPEYASRAEPLWSAVNDLAPMLDPPERRNPYIPVGGPPGGPTLDQLPMRKRMAEVWSRHDQGQIDFRAHHDEAQTIRRETVEAIRQANPDLVGTLLTDGRHYALIHRGTVEDEPFRVTYFDESGPYSHGRADSAINAVAEAVRAGFLDFGQPDAFQALTRGKAFSDGVDSQKVRDFDHELRFAQPQSAAAMAFGNLPFEAQLRVVNSPELMAEFRAGRVPGDLAGLVEPRAYDLTPPDERPKPPPRQVEQLGLFPGSETAAGFPRGKLQPKGRQVPTENLLDGLRPPRPTDPDLFPKPKEAPSDTESGVELGMFFGLPLSPNQRRILRQAFRRVLSREDLPIETIPEEMEAVPGRWKSFKAHLAMTRSEEGVWRPGLYALEGYLQSLGGRAAEALARAVRNVQWDHLARGTRWYDLLGEAEKLAGNEKAVLRRALMNADQPLNAIAGMTANVRAAFEVTMRLIHPDTGEIPVLARELDVRGYTGPGGEEGPPRPFEPRRGDLMPRILTREWLKGLGDRRSQVRDRTARFLVETGQVPSLPEARDLIGLYLKETTRDPWAPGLTRARRLVFPEEAYVQDPIAALRIRADQAAHRFAAVENLGKNFSFVTGNMDIGRDGWIGQIEREHGRAPAHAALTLVKAAFGGMKRADIFSNVFGTIQNYETMTKLPLAFVQNMSQNALAGVIAGMRPWLKATAETAGFFGPAGRQRAKEAAEVTGVWYREAIRDMEVQAGLVESSGLGNLARYPLFIWRWSELNINRTIAARTGILAMERIDQQLRAGRQLSKATRRLLEQLDFDASAIQRQDGLTPEQIRRGAWGLLDLTQFMERPSAVPALFDPRGPLGPAGPFIGQWKGYVTRLNRLIYNNMILEAKQGNFGPISRFALLVAPVAGELVGQARALIGGRDRKWIWDEEGWDLLGHWFKNMTEGFGMGVVAELVERTAMSGWGPGEFLAGPGLTQIFNAMTEAVAGGKNALRLGADYTPDAQRAMERWFRDVGRQTVRQVPLIGRPVGARLYTEAEQLATMDKDIQRAMHQAAQYQAEANSRTGADAQAYYRKAIGVLEDLNRKYRNTPGYVPRYNPSPQAVRDAMRTRQMSDEERARLRLPKAERGAQPPTFPWNLLPGALRPPGSAMAPAIGAAMTAMVAYNPGDPRFDSIMRQLEAQTGRPIPRPPVMALAKVAAQAEAEARGKALAALPPGEARQVAQLLASLRPPGVSA